MSSVIQLRDLQKSYFMAGQAIPVLKGINLDIISNEYVALMGPSGSGKSTLANALMGHPLYSVEGTALLDSQDILKLETNERSTKGLFLSFQYPAEIEGVTVKNFLRQAVNARREKPIRISEFKKIYVFPLEIE